MVQASGATVQASVYFYVSGLHRPKITVAGVHGKVEDRGQK